jgi:hypothetical protein
VRVVLRDGPSDGVECEIPEGLEMYLIPKPVRGITLSDYMPRSDYVDIRLAPPYADIYRRTGDVRLYPDYTWCPVYVYDGEI